MTALAPAPEASPTDMTDSSSSWLDRLAPLTRALAGGPGADSSHQCDPRLEAHLRHAQKLAVAGRVATGLVHDFNNAVLVAVACLDLIGDVPDDPAFVREQSRTAAEALRRASELARRVATFGRPDDGARRLADLNDLVRACARLATPATGTGIDVTVSCPGQPLPVLVEAAQIEQAILNLCLNARDAMPKGGRIRLTTQSTVRWVPRDAGGRGRVATTYAVVEVSDTGVGIPHDLQTRVFEPFFTTKAPEQGSGLGLAMVRETALAHEGLVELTSDAEGTAFRLLLPLR